MDYILTLKGGKRERWTADVFHSWVRSQNQRVGTSVPRRMQQLRDYTGRDVVDWFMTDDKPGTGENIL